MCVDIDYENLGPMHWKYGLKSTTIHLLLALDLKTILSGIGLTAVWQIYRPSLPLMWGLVFLILLDLAAGVIRANKTGEFSWKKFRGVTYKVTIYTISFMMATILAGMTDWLVCTLIDDAWALILGVIEFESMLRKFPEFPLLKAWKRLRKTLRREASGVAEVAFTDDEVTDE